MNFEDALSEFQAAAELAAGTLAEKVRTRAEYERVKLQRATEVQELFAQYDLADAAERNAMIRLHVAGARLAEATLRAKRDEK